MAEETSAKATKSETRKAAPADRRSTRSAGHPPAAAPVSEEGTAAAPNLLSGGNPQIAKGYGEAPVQAYIAAMPGWKREVGRRLDALIAREVPGLRKAVKWNTPLYGLDDRSWFLGFHCFTKYVKVTFFRGLALEPVPPVASKSADTRYFHIHEGEPLDEDRLADWVRQASRLPGERM